MKRKTVAAIIASMLAPLADCPAIADPLCNPLMVANAFMAKNYPLFDVAGLRPAMSDLGSIWALTYRIPRGDYGIAPTIVIEKRTCSVISTQYRQK